MIDIGICDPLFSEITECGPGGSEGGFDVVLVGDIFTTKVADFVRIFSSFFHADDNGFGFAAISTDDEVTSFTFMTNTGKAESFSTDFAGFKIFIISFHGMIWEKDIIYYEKTF